MNEKLHQLLENHSALFIHQIKEWTEILTNFETRNKYEILDETGAKVGFIAERNKGLGPALLRQILGSHRSMDIMIWNAAKEEILHLKRPFYWIWSNLTVSFVNQKIGSVKRRFSFFYKIYDLQDSSGRVFARIKAPFWRLWTFPIFNPSKTKVGEISKKWGGVLKEMFTDADKFQVQFAQWNTHEKAIVLAAAISIDLDYFEDNSRNK